MESKMFWGICFLVVGVLLLVNYVLGVNLPIGRTLVAIAFIYIGVNMLFGDFGFHIRRQATEHAAVFSSSHFHFEWPDQDKDNGKDDSVVSGKINKEYKTVFGEGVLDLSDVDLSKGAVNIKIKTAFGQTKVIIKKGTPLRIHTNTVFGSSELPEKNLSALGKFNYSSDGLSKDAPALNIDSDVAFGSFQIIEK